MCNYTNHEGNRSVNGRMWRGAMLLAVAGLLLSGASACEKLESSAAQADRQVERDIKAASMPAGRVSDEASLSKLKAAAARSDDSLPEHARAVDILAQDQLHAAIGRILQFQEQQLDVQTKLLGLSRLAAQIAAAGTAVEIGQKSDPVEVLASIDKKIADRNAELDKVNGEMTGLRTDLKKRQDQVDAETAQKMAAEIQAEAMVSRSNAAKGQESADLFKQARETRKIAGITGANIEAQKLEMRPVQTDIQLRQGLVNSLNESLKSLADDKANLQKGWEGMAGQIKAQQSFADTLYSEQFVRNAHDLKILADRLDTEGAAAEKLLDEAIDNFKLATTTLSTKYEQELGIMANSPKFQDTVEKTIWTNLRTVFASNNFRFDLGEAWQMRGCLLTTIMSDLELRQKLLAQIKQNLDKVGKELPAEIAVDLTEPLKTAGAKAIAAYVEAGAACKIVADAPPASILNPSLKNSARGAEALAMYGKWQVQAARNDPEASKSQDEAKSLAKQADILLPNETPAVPDVPLPGRPTTTPGTPEASPAPAADPAPAPTPN